VVTLAALALLTILVGASGCAGGSTGGSTGGGGPARSTAPASTQVDQPSLARALGATRAVQSGRVEVTTAITDLDDAPDPPPGGRLTVAQYRVAFDRRAARVEVEADLAAAERAARGDARAGDGAEGESGGEVRPAAHLIAAGDVVYARAGAITGAWSEPGDWVGIERAAFEDRRPTGDAAALLLDPLGPFGVLGDATGDARMVGHDVIRGSPVTHLVAGLDARRGAAQVDAWIDADEVIRRVEIALAGTGGSGGASPGRVVTTVELFDIGRAVVITPPGEER
jgi:hypothetical protein